MRSDIFFDTNVLLYLPDADRTKADRTEALLIEGGVASALVLAEVTFVLVRKWKWPWPTVHDLLATLRANTIVLPLTDEAVARGTAYAGRYRLQVYDATIVASAVLAGCTTLFSEDLHNGLVIDGLTIRNPYAAD